MVNFCKQKTAYEMRISDWSSDVCSSDLARGAKRIGTLRRRIEVASQRLYSVLFIERLDQGGVAINRQGHHFKVLAAPFIIQPIERGHFFSERWAPGRPTIKKHDLSKDGRQAHLLSRFVLKGDGGQVARRMPAHKALVPNID